jgi:hypothetical protein
MRMRTQSLHSILVYVFSRGNETMSMDGLIVIDSSNVGMQMKTQ